MWSAHCIFLPNKVCFPPVSQLKGKHGVSRTSFFWLAGAIRVRYLYNGGPQNFFWPSYTSPHINVTLLPLKRRLLGKTRRDWILLIVGNLKGGIWRYQLMEMTFFKFHFQIIHSLSTKTSKLLLTICEGHIKTYLLIAVESHYNRLWETPCHFNRISDAFCTLLRRCACHLLSELECPVSG